MSSKSGLEVDWSKIKTTEDWRAFWARLRQIERTAKRKQKKIREDKIEAVGKKHRTEMQALPIDTEVTQTRFYYEPHSHLNGKVGKKLKDGTKYMAVVFPHKPDKIFSIPYSDIQLEPMSEEAIASKNRVVGIVARVLTSQP